MLEAVIFDMDGVLVDSEPEHLKVSKMIYKDLGIKFDTEENNKFIGSNSNYKWGYLKEHYSLSQPIEELIKLATDTYYNHINSKEVNLKAMPGVIELVKSLSDSGYKIAVGSSSNLNAIEATLKEIKLDKHLKVIASGQFVEHGKPYPDTFLLAAKKLNVNPKNCLVIEDSHNGVIAAGRAEMKCIGYNSPNSHNQDISMADKVIDDFNEITIKDIKELFD